MLAMGIVTMLVLMIANMFQQASQAWNIGTQSAEMHVAGRSAAEFMAREMAQAVAGPIEIPDPRPAGVLDVIQFHVQNDKAWFVTLSGEPNRTNAWRSLRSALFSYDPDELALKYLRGTASFGAYTNQPPDSGANQVLVENVVGFALRVYPSTTNLIANSYQAGYDSADYSDKLPAAVDIFVEVLGSDDVVKYLQLGKDSEFKRHNSRCYTTRVYFNNRLGFQARP